VDTRSKIISTEAAVEIARRLKARGGKLTVVTGTFDVLVLAHARHLSLARNGGRGALMVVLLPAADPLLPLAARAELVAALSMVDYVVTPAEAEIGQFLQRLEPDQLISRQTADAEERLRLIEHVQRRHSGN